EHFRPAVLQADHTLTRAWRRQRGFAEPAERPWPAQPSHPRTRDRSRRQLQQAQSPYARLTPPSLFESGQAQLTARTLLIDVPEEVQLQRASARDGNDAEQIRRIMAAQLSRQERRARADDVADNSGSLEQLYAQLQGLHERYLNYARR